MGERWVEMSPEADIKQEKRFERLIKAEEMSFETEESRKKYQERCTLIRDAVQLKKYPKEYQYVLPQALFP